MMTLRERRRAERRHAETITIGAPVHIADQMSAAHAGAESLIQGAREAIRAHSGQEPDHHRGPDKDPDKTRLAFAAVQLAARDRVQRMCPHTNDHRPRVVDLSSGMAYCDGCGIESVLPRTADGTVVLVNDGRCDICSFRPPGGLFRPFAIEFGDGGVFMGEVGGCCEPVILDLRSLEA